MPDGSPTDGAHPVSVQVLKEYLQGDVSATAAAFRITRPVISSENYDEHLAVLWNFLIDALMELSHSQMLQVLDLLQAIEDMREPVLPVGVNHPLWQHLPYLMTLWSDELRKGAWRDYVHTRTPVHQPTWLLQRVRTAQVEASLVVRGLGWTPLWWGLADICDALESSEAILDIELPSIAEWFAIAGTQISHSATSRDEVHATGVTRDLWSNPRGSGNITSERWFFWERRVEELMQTDHDERTRSALTKIAACMVAKRPSTQVS